MGKEGKPGAKPSVAIIGTRGYPSYYGGFETAVRRSPHSWLRRVGMFRCMGGAAKFGSTMQNGS